MAEHSVKYSIDERDQYTQACKHSDVVPVSFILKHGNEEMMNLSHRGLGDRGLTALSTFLMTNNSIRELNLADNGLGSLAGFAIANFLKTNDTITSLNLAGNQLGVDGVNAIAEVLSSKCKLVYLNLSYNRLDDRVAFALKNMVEPEWCTIRKLDLSHNLLSEGSSSALVRFIKKKPISQIKGSAFSSNSSLISLNLSWNCFRRKGAGYLLRGIQDSRTLKELDLSHNALNGLIFDSIAKLIITNKIMESLDVSYNKLDVACCAAISKALSRNETLKKLNLSNNYLTEQGLLHLLESMKINKTLEEVNVDNTITLVDEKRTPLFLKRFQEESRLIWNNPLERQQYKNIPNVKIEDSIM